MSLLLLERRKFLRNGSSSFKIFSNGDLFAMQQRTPITDLLFAWNSGDRTAIGALAPLVFEDLRRMAGGVMSSDSRHATLRATALASDAFMALARNREPNWSGRAHFFSAAAEQMRRILIDYARRRAVVRRGAEMRKTHLTVGNTPSMGPDVGPEILAVHEVRDRLALFDPRQAEIVKLRYFGEATIEEIAGITGLSPATVKREWTMARAWLRRQLERDVDSKKG